VPAILLLLALVGLGPSLAWAQNGRAPALSAEAVLLLDERGGVLYAKNAAEDRAPASLVKLMTLYLAFEELEAGGVRLDDPVTVSRQAAETPRFRMGLRAGERVPLVTLLDGIAIASANDAATALAEHLAGSEEGFVARMNGRAAELGLGATRFANPHGLPDPLQRTTAQDMARLMLRLMEDHPAARALLGGRAFVYRGRVHSRRIPLFEEPGGVQALKTGFTNEAGYNLAVMAWRAGHRFLLVVLGAQSRPLSFRDARRLLEYGFSENGIETVQEPRRPVLPRRLPGRGSGLVAPAG
jgi:D-alanyl-D-alanine carboxypeptidase (penicillin-binding protein 5/6)